MKQLLLKATVLAMISTSIASTNAQKSITLQVGDSLEMNATEGFKTYQWQVSTDGKAYLSLPNETGKTLSILPYTQGFYRVKAEASDGSTVFVDTTKVDFASFTINKTSDISAAHGYVEVNGKPGSGISIPEENRGPGGILLFNKKLTAWNNPNAHAVYYLSSPSSNSSLSMLMTASANAVVQFRLRVYAPNDLATPIVDTYISVKGTGAEQEIPMYTIKRRSKYAYYRYDLECLSGNTSIANISRWRFRTATNETSFAPSYLSSPSVHLSGWKSTEPTAPKGQAYNWCYQEIMIPESSDYSGTYAMSLGVLSGYMGIQVNGPVNRDVIFSIWDDGSTDEDPGLADYKKAGAVDAASYVTVSRFGNEGTGAKTFVSGDWWKLGRYVQFITNSRPEVAQYTIKDQQGKDSTFTRHNTLVTAWFNSLDNKGWKYIATIRLPGSGRNFDSWYSFLENYSWSNGQVERKAYYRNGYGRAISGDKWFHFNKVGFGHTDGGTNIGARNDYGQGRVQEQPNTFFMTTGGYTPTVTKESDVALNVDNTPVDTINLTKLLDRVDEAIAREDSINKAAEQLQQSIYGKTGWKVVTFSSQETSGEGSNGRAAQIIDGNATTYWHSAWKSGSSSLPHQFVVDMLQSQPVNGFMFTLSGGETRYQKGIDIYASNDNVNWKKVYVNDACPKVEKYYLEMDSVVTMRYFKLVIRTTQTGVVHTRINEIDVTRPMTPPTGVATPTTKGSNTLSVFPSPATTNINVVAPVDAEDMLVELYTSTGERCLSQHVYNQTAGEVTNIKLPNLSGGVYVARAIIKGKNYSRLIIVK